MPTLLEALINLSKIEMVELEKTKNKIAKLQNEISNLSPEIKEIKLLKNIHFNETEIQLLQKIMEGIKFSIETHILNFDLIHAGMMRTKCFEDILRLYGPTGLPTKIKTLFFNISMEE